MWVLSFVAREERGVFGTVAEKFKVNMIGYSLNNYRKGKHDYLLAVGMVFCEEGKLKKIFKDFRKDKRIVKLETFGNFFTIITRRPISKKFSVFYNPAVIHIKPVLIDKYGYEHWEVASFNKKDIIKIMDVEKKYNSEIKKFCRERVKNVAIMSIFPDLTDKQKQAVELAVKHGYYEYPKKIELMKLAKLMDISFSTYQAHLKKAEGRIVPFIIKHSK